jgi:hypothetical protein
MWWKKLPLFFIFSSLFLGLVSFLNPILLQPLIWVGFISAILGGISILVIKLIEEFRK